MWLFLVACVVYVTATIADEFIVGFAIFNLAAMRWHLLRNSHLSGQDMYRLLLLVHSGINEELRHGVKVQSVILRAACPRLSTDTSETCLKVKDAISSGLIENDSAKSVVTETEKFLDAFEPMEPLSETIEHAARLIRTRFGITMAPSVTWSLMNRPNL